MKGLGFHVQGLGLTFENPKPYFSKPCAVSAGVTIAGTRRARGKNSEGFLVTRDPNVQGFSPKLQTLPGPHKYVK